MANNEMDEYKLKLFIHDNPYDIIDERGYSVPVNCNKLKAVYFANGRENLVVEIDVEPGMYIDTVRELAETGKDKMVGD